MADTTKALASTISALPELQRKKGEIDAHMNIATCLLEQIKSRSLDSFYSIEECVMERRSLPKDDRATLTQLMADGEGGGSVDDRLRLFLLLTDLLLRRLPHGPRRSTLVHPR